MDPRRPSATDRAPLDDAALAVLVRDVADEWSMPPQRLDQLTWRERVERKNRWGRAGFGLRWTRPLLGAAAVAIVATVSLSLAALWLTAPRGDHATVGSSPSPGASSTPVPSGPAAPAASPMPKLALSGDLPTPSRIMVQTGQGWHIADLATGDLSPMLIQVGLGPTAVLARPGGGWVCICGNGQNAIRLSLQTIDRNGVVGAAVPFKDIVGTEDPSESGALQPFLADVSVTASSDGRLGLVGWIYRDGAAGWQVGADLIDLESLATVASTQLLLDQPIVVDGRARLPFAPIVRSSPAGDRILLAILASVTETGSGPGSYAEHWLAPFDGRSIGALAEAGSTNDDGCLDIDSGLIDTGQATDDAVYYSTCWSQAGALRVNRVAADGRVVTTTEFPGSLGGVDRANLASPSGDALYSWNPFETVLSRVDLRNGELSVGKPQRPNPTGLTNGQGDLIVVSADGTRVYTLGIPSTDAAGLGDSAGVYAFDASTLEPLGHWAPPADLTSIAVSDDGRHVYAAASGGPSPAGAPGPEFGASITAYDTSDGSVAVIAGRLLARDLTLGEGICR
jgi:hypothetical protein